MGRISRAVVFFTILACTTGFDYGTKEWARSELSVDVAKPVIEGFWYWELAYNDGAAFSSLRGSQILLSLIAAAALVLLGVMAHKTRPEAGQDAGRGQDSEHENSHAAIILPLTLRLTRYAWFGSVAACFVMTL